MPDVSFETHVLVKWRTWRTWTQTPVGVHTGPTVLLVGPDAYVQHVCNENVGGNPVGFEEAVSGIDDVLDKIIFGQHIRSGSNGEDELRQKTRRQISSK